MCALMRLENYCNEQFSIQCQLDIDGNLKLVWLGSMNAVAHYWVWYELHHWWHWQCFGLRIISVAISQDWCEAERDSQPKLIMKLSHWLGISQVEAGCKLGYLLEGLEIDNRTGGSQLICDRICSLLEVLPEHSVTVVERAAKCK